MKEELKNGYVYLVKTTNGCFNAQYKGIEKGILIFVDYADKEHRLNADTINHIELICNCCMCDPCDCHK
jgi:hypothetical protein